MLGTPTIQNTITENQKKYRHFITAEKLIVY